MMFHSQGASKHTCSLLAATCGKNSEKLKKDDAAEDKPRYPFPELVSSGRLEVQTLTSPSKAGFCKILESYNPSIVYLQGEQIANDEVGPLVWEGVDMSTPEAISEIFATTLPTAVYLEIPNGEKVAEVLHSKGIPYVIYWKNSISYYAACHFRQALFSVVQSSSTHAWDAFQLARASFRLYCVRNNYVLPANSQKVTGELEPCILGDRLKINVDPPEIDAEGEGDDESSSGALPAIKIHDDDVTLRFLVCGVPCTLDASLLESLEDGLNALLNIEIRGSKLHGKFSAPPPPLQAGTFSRGVVTMRCDVTTCSFAHISLLVSGSAQTCFDDQLLENHIKNEIIEKSQLVHALPDSEENKITFSEPRRSASIACGAAVFEVCMKVPSWASQVLRQSAPDVSYRSLVALGIASIQGLPVASFERDDAERLLFFCPRHGKDTCTDNLMFSSPPSWLRPPAPTRKRSEPSKETTPGSRNGVSNKRDVEDRDARLRNGVSMPLLPARKKLKVAAMRPIPHVQRHKMTPFSGMSEADGHEGGQVKANLPVVAPTKHSIVGSTPTTQRRTYSSSSQAKQIISLNPLPLKKHGCGRSPMLTCSEEEFLKDVMQFLILRGHTRLIPQGGLAEFPDAILNGKRLDLFNLYKEVVTRGGFHVGNGINWKGQIFSKMHNYTMTNRMTGVGNTLKRHYETYLLEYELAHDDVDGECCLLCHSSAPGDWVNCGICGEWAHFGCDRRQGLGAFKDYAKTDGLEYICPHCSITNFKKKPQKVGNGYSQGLMEDCGGSHKK
ncbi:AT-rich interactive domain-containing protein 4-like isoform X2 [Carya illinoinensis]|uniref:AT-rich interactive domain-containing protein 4-like isoform X1 n=1 Tax=Carya illinoinensis TaxID=32201 RepID=UPI001C726BA5|nr:AT-rich interactive domain-containing protein 4-like isoform X1 [Carya illinoinensis]XP_042946634.1 AT-rich interactive domain-containing protein 4-like isoform X1 [Carya illinoinensis]XP_042946642.1 AT-rich interactive domain-containing protein 4-like isoform X1 [Carya illinoinensis]XP_042946650.1 AT-rich interactive domain-containing protein 4-like isoform X1 [Carya illinoinensis]XP_042946657.1 AT-rich interactive domain-containing protein 4-like isoform X2 [Carya illinoinensis]